MKVPRSHEMLQAFLTLMLHARNALFTGAFFSILKSTQLSYVCLAAVPYHHHCRTCFTISPPYQLPTSSPDQVTYTIPSSSTLLLQPLGHRNTELLLLLRNIRFLLPRRITFTPHLQHIPNDLITLRVHDTHIRGALVRYANPDFDRHDLACVPCLRVVRVVGELQTGAQPEVAFRGVILCVFGGELGAAFDVRGVVETDVLFDFGAAGAGLGGGDEAVAEDGGCKGQECGESEVHCGGCVGRCVRWCRSKDGVVKCKTLLYIFTPIILSLIWQHQYLEDNPDKNKELQSKWRNRGSVYGRCSLRWGLSARLERMRQALVYCDLGTSGLPIPGVTRQYISPGKGTRVRCFRRRVPTSAWWVSMYDT
jgi:hypothetical protein